MAKPKRVIGIDYGSVRIGLSVSDAMQIIATPLKTVPAAKKSEKTAENIVEEITRYCKEFDSDIETIVVGLPLMMNGSVGYIADEVHHFVELLKQKTTIPVVTLDERLTSVQAERSMREFGLSSKQQKKHVDSVAAVLILQNYLDIQHFKKTQPTA